MNKQFWKDLILTFGLGLSNSLYFGEGLFMHFTEGGEITREDDIMLGGKSSQ